MFRKILVALDRTDGAATDVLNRARDLAKATGAKLRFVNVLLPLDGGYPEPIYLAGDGFYGSVSTDVFRQHLTDWRQSQEQTSDWLQALTDQAEAAGIEADYELRYGEPNRAICDAAREWPADLVVIGRRGRRGLSEFLLGSVSNYVMHHALCSVLTVQGTDELPPVESTSQPAAKGETAESSQIDHAQPLA